MQKLMTMYEFSVTEDEKKHIHLLVTRLSDNVTKYFYQASGTVEGMVCFMNSITDELAEGYFPKPRKTK